MHRKLLPPFLVSPTHPSNALAGVAPGKKLVGIAGIGILAVIPNAVFKSAAIVVALYPDGAALIVEVTAL